MYDLHMRPADFWDSTPAIYDKLVQRHDATVERGFYRIGILCSLVANMFRDSKKQSKAYKPSDFVPGNQDKAKTDDVMSPEEMLARFQSGFGHLIKH